MAGASLVARVATATTYTAVPYPRTAIPTAIERHFLNRLGTGFCPSSFAAMKARGGAQEWFAWQLSPGEVPESAKTDGLLDWFPRLSDTPQERVARNSAGTYGAWEYARDLGNWTVLRRIYSTREVHETMVDFWTNHLHIPANGVTGWQLRSEYDQTIREHALGRFEDLLLACSLHPAMLLYLDNFKSVRNAPNENQGRELLELHTVGRTSGYTEDMVKDSARILSGWTTSAGADWKATYDTGRHTTGPVQVLGFTDPNASSDGSELTVRYLRYLARHPATARTFARRLAVRFVSDTPSDALVAHLASVFTDSGTDIAATLRALVAHPEFRESAGHKVSTPHDDLVRTARVLGVSASKPTLPSSFANSIAWIPRGMLLYQWPRPDGAPRPTRSGPRLPGCWRPGGCTGSSSAATTRSPARPTASRCRGCRSRGSGSTSTSTTWSARCSAAGRPVRTSCSSARPPDGGLRRS